MSFLWMHYPHLFPTITEQQAIRIVNFFDAQNSEQLTDLTLNLVMLTCFVVASLVVLLVAYLHKHLAKRLTTHG